MRLGFNLPEAVEKVTIKLEGSGQTKEYTFTTEEFKVFSDDKRRSTLVNSVVGPDWPKSLIGKVSKRTEHYNKKMAEQATADKEEN